MGAPELAVDVIEAPYHNAEHALSRAGRIWQRPILQAPSTYSLVGRSRQTGGTVTPWERHAQAAMVVAVLQRHLKGAELAYVAARYFKQIDQACPVLVEAVLRDDDLRALTGSRRGVTMLVRNTFLPSWKPWFGKLARGGVPLEELRKQYRTPLAKVGVRMNLRKEVVCEAQRMVVDRLKAVHTAAVENIEPYFEEAGLI